MKRRGQVTAHPVLRAGARVVPPFVFRVKELLLVAIHTDGSPIDLPAVGFGWLTEEDIPRLERLGYQAGSARAALHSGSRAAVATSDGRIVGCYWFDPRPQEYEGWLCLMLRPGDAVAEVRVDPEFRGRGVAGAIRRFASPELRAGGIDRIVGVISRQNRPSRRAATRGEYQTLGTVRYVRVLGFTLLDVSGSWRLGWWGWGRWFELDALQANG